MSEREVVAPKGAKADTDGANTANPPGRPGGGPGARDAREQASGKAGGGSAAAGAVKVPVVEVGDKPAAAAPVTDKVGSGKTDGAAAGESKPPDSGEDSGEDSGADAEVKKAGSAVDAQGGADTETETETEAEAGAVDSEPAKPAREDTDPETAELADIEDVETLRWIADELRLRVEVAGNQRDEHLEHLRRLKAEFDNYRKRMIKERTEIVDRANIGLVDAILPALDSLEMAFLSSSPENPLHPGIEAVCAQVIDILNKEGLERIEPARGNPFDPATMEPVARTAGEAGPDGPTVTKMLRPGYRMKGRLLRAAMVEVKG